MSLSFFVFSTYIREEASSLEIKFSQFDTLYRECYNFAMIRNIVLIGFMGTGKSTLAGILQQQLGRKAVSTDAMVEKLEAKSIAEIFKNSGEGYFRNLEHRVVRDLSNQEGLIIDCGGGAVLNPDNIQALKKNGILIHLACEPQEILRRVQMQPKRPLLDVSDPLSKINELLNVRQPFYEKADVTLDTTDGDLHRVAREVITYVKQN